MAYYTSVAPQLRGHHADLETILTELNALLLQCVDNDTERVRLDAAIRNISHSKKILNLIICDSRI